MKSQHLLVLLLLLAGTSLLSGQKAKETPSNGSVVRVMQTDQTVERLVIRSGQEYVVQDGQLEVGTLIMEDKSTIILTRPNTMIVVGIAIVGKKCAIQGVGKKGRDGGNGSNGLANIVPGRFVDGSPGQAGQNGGDGLNLKLFIGEISFLSPLIIRLDGGQGGKGGNGGNGGTLTKAPRDSRPARGFNGGDSGVPGAGGAGGKLILLLGTTASKNGISFMQAKGNGGDLGTPGKAGVVIVRISGRDVSRTNMGKPGKQLPGRIPFSHQSDDVNFISFPDPPPNPSDLIDDLPIKFGPGSTVGTVKNRLATALNSCGYRNMRYYCVEDGFAVVTGIEHIDQNGVPLPPADRFSGDEALFNKEFTLQNIISAMFLTNKSYSRIIVFVVSTKILSTTPEPISRDEAIGWFKSSLLDLPEATQQIPYTNDHKVSALIYEFSKEANKTGVKFSKEPQISAELHLRGAKLLPGLTSD